MEIRHPERLFSPHRMTPQRCPDDVDVTVQPRASASASAFSTSFFGCLALILLTRYNNHRNVVYTGIAGLIVRAVQRIAFGDVGADVKRLVVIRSLDRVIMASMNKNLVPLPAAVCGWGDEVERESAETEERALVYVSATRAKKELLVLSFGAPSRLP